MLQVVGTIDIGILKVPTDINVIISGLTQLILAAGGLVFFAMLILGGFKYLNAGGDEKAASSARQTLTQAFIGIIIIVASFVVADLIFNIFKVPGIGVF